MMTMDALIRSANALPPLPAAVARLIALLTDNESSLGQIDAVLSSDGALAAKVLRMANSAVFSGREPVGTVRAAVLRLGFGPILAMAVAAGAQKHLDVALPQYGLNQGAMWKHSQAARISAAVIGQYAPWIPPEAATAALLHDIGKIVLARRFSSGELALLHEAGGATQQSEMEIMQVHHGELGGLIAQHWNLPRSIVLGIIYHHNPRDCETEDNTICHVTALADWIAKSAQALLTGNADYTCAPESAGELQLQPPQLNDMCAVVAEQLGSW